MSDIDEGLIAGEKVVYRTEKHWIAPLADSKWAILMLIGVVVLAWLQPATREGFFSFVWRLVDLIQLGLFLGAIGWIVYNVVAWRTAEYGVTTMRVRGHEGLVKKRSTDSLLTSISDVQSKSGVVGRSLGFGNIRIMTASGDTGDDTFTSVKGMEEFKRALLEQKADAAMKPPPPVAAAPAAVVAAPVVAAAAPAPPAPDPMTTISELAKLRDAGAISPAEFEAKKVELLARI